MQSFSCIVEETIPKSLRLDRYIAEYLKLLSRSQIKARNLSAIVDGKTVKVSRILKGGEHLELSWAEAESLILTPENLSLDIVYEDQRVIVVNKAQGLVVHPGAGNRSGTLANALLYRMFQRMEGMQGREADKAMPNIGLRPGIVHRLDKDTSGLIISALDEEAHAFLAAQFKARKVRKSYAAIVLGCPKEQSGCIDKNLTRSNRDRKIFTVSDTKGKPGQTYYKLVRCYGKYSLLLLRPKTGRTHQIRVHLKYLGTPILGDSLYGVADSRFPKATLMLHAKRLSLVLPSGKLETFKTALPQRFKDIIPRLSSGR